MDVCLKQQQNINNSQFRGANIKKGKKKKKYTLNLPLQSMHYCTMDCISINKLHASLHVYDNVHGNNFISLYHVLMLANSEQF
jgi:hypothetical protein